MSIKIQEQSEIMEIVARKLSGIHSVPYIEQLKMIARCAKAVHEYHEQIIRGKDITIRELKDELELLERNRR